MNTYPLRSLASLCTSIAGGLFLGTVSFVTMLNGNGGPVTFMFGVVALGYLYSTLRSVHTICLVSDGSIHFARLLGTTRMYLDNISVIEGFRKNEYNGPVWKMRVRYGQHTITVDNFDDVPEFIKLVRTLAPTIHVQGEWPTLDPWGETTQDLSTSQ